MSVMGVLASFVLLLSTVVCEQVNSNSGNLENVTATEELASVKLADLPFFEYLENPCSFSVIPGREGESSPHFRGTRLQFVEQVYEYIRDVSGNNDVIQTLLQDHSISGCESLHVDDLPHTPTLAELKEMNIQEALNKIYLSSLMHSAYFYIEHYEVNNTNIRCLNDIEKEQKMANQSFDLGRKHQSIACYLLTAIYVLGFERDDVMPYLNFTITDLLWCSRRELRHCQVLASAQKFLRIINDYAVDTLGDSFVSFASWTLSTSPIDSALKIVSTPTIAAFLDILTSSGASAVNSTGSTTRATDL